MKQIIRINERQLEQIVMESVKKVLRKHGSAENEKEKKWNDYLKTKQQKMRSMDGLILPSC